jgi:serine/threonine protein kinase
MVLDLCAGGDLAFHLSSKDIFNEKEAKFFIAEVILAIEHLH